MKLNDIREQRALKVAEMRGILSAADSAKRNLTADEQTKFDALKAEISAIEANEARAQFLEDAERRSIGTGAEQRDHADLEGRISLMKILQAGMEGRSLSGAEAEYAQETERRTGRKAQGVFVPMAALEKRVNTTTSGNDLVSTDHRADQYIGPFRNSLLARRLGVRVLSGLRGNVAIPKYTTGLSAGWIAEGSNVSAAGDMAFSTVSLTPKHAGGVTEMSRQLIQQSSPDIEQLIRDDLSFVLAQAIDSALIKGGGSNEPVGILANLAASGGVQTGSLATFTWGNINRLIEKAEMVNAPVASWLTHPAVATKLRITLKDAGLGFILENGRMADMPVYVTNQVPINTTPNPDTGRLILGDWSQVMLGVWSEVDILVNPYDSTAYARGGVLVRAMSTVDIAIRHPESFVVADDIAL
jgi:HK97 family phage major capsid protein